MKDLSLNDLYEMIALEVGDGATPKSAKRYLKAIYKIILRQLQVKHRICFKGFGYWEIKERKSGERQINDPTNGGKRLVYVKPKYSIFFKPSENFDKSVNENDFKICTDKGVKRIEAVKEPMNFVDLINTANNRRKE